jgi:hypothetical protein
MLRRGRFEEAKETVSKLPAIGRKFFGLRLKESCDLAAGQNSWGASR